MKPFVLLQSRPEDETSDNEYDAFLKFCNLAQEELLRYRVEKESIAGLKLKDYSGVLIGGGPFNMSDPYDKKSDTQKRVEAELYRLLDEVVTLDFPLLATCYGIGLIVAHQGGTVSTKYGEQLDAVTISLNESGQKDPLLAGLEKEFSAFVGHKEAAETVPESAVVLADSVWCPVQMLRIKSNIYVTQFHPELDSIGLETRIRAYRHHGYFQPDEMDELINMGYSKRISEPSKILKNFVDIYSVAS